MRGQKSEVRRTACSHGGLLDRRRFLGGIGIAGGLTAAAGLPSLLMPGVLKADDIEPVDDRVRRSEALRIRFQSAIAESRIPLAQHPTNGDEQLYANKIANYSKVLPHNSLGEPDVTAYQAMVHALSTGNASDFTAIPFGGGRKIAGPMAAYNFGLEGADSHQSGLVAPPSFNSARMASEVAEDYWHALTRDVAFINYDSDPTVNAAASDLSTFSDFIGPKSAGAVTTATLFRGSTPGDLVGPHISQFLWLDVPFGAGKIVQQYKTPVPGDDHMTSFAEWLNIQNGGAASSGQTLDPVPRYIRDQRGLAEYSHRDYSGQASVTAGLILSSYGNAALDANDPYLGTLAGFGGLTFAMPHIVDLLGRITLSSLCANFFQKWLVHRNLRPEEFGARVHNLKVGAANYPINPELLNSPVLVRTFEKYGTYLLPQAYQDGSPAFPSYPAAHATVVGAGVTMLKAFFRESFVIPNAVVASADGLSLLPYTGPDLTIGGELNKLASNLGVGGRNAAAVHYRSDGIQGVLLGEALAIRVLTDLRLTYPEHFSGFSLTRFDGTSISV